MPPPPPPVCASASFTVFKQPPKARSKVAKSLVCFCSEIGINLGGFVRRKSNEELEILLVLENYPESKFHLLWEHIKGVKFAKVGTIVIESFRFKENDYINAPLLDCAFQVLKANGTNEGWSVYDERDFDHENDIYSLVSSLRW